MASTPGSAPDAGVRRGMNRLLTRLRAPGTLRIIENSGWMMGEQMLKLVGSLAVGILIARHLGVATFGELGFAMAYSGLFAIVGTLGLNRIGVRELVSARTAGQDASAILDTMLLMRVLVSLVLTLVVVGSAWLLHQGNLLLITIVAPMVMFSSLDVVELWFQSQTLAKRTSSARSVSYLVVMAFRIVLLVRGAGVAWFAFAYLLEFIGAAIALFTVYHRTSGRFRLRRVDRLLAFRLLGESWPEIIAGFAGLLYIRLDQVMLGNLMGDHAVGIFAVASRLSESWYFVPIALVGSTFPNIVRVRETDPALYIRRIGALMRGLVALSYGAIAMTTLFAPFVIVKLYGVPFRQSATILMIHIWCGLFMSLGLASGSWIMAEKRVKLNLYRNLCGAAVNIVLNLILIPRFGPIGASCATLSSLIAAYMLFDMAVPQMHAVSKAKWRALVLLP
jgi:O-antigen/teichoic acid export membrane protein